MSLASFTHKVLRPSAVPVPGLRSPVSNPSPVPIQPHPAGPATNCQYLYHQPKRQDGHTSRDAHTHTHTHTQARPHSGTQLQVTQASGQSLYLPNSQTRPANPNQADPDDIPEHCWKRKVVPKKDRQQPVLVADPRTCLLRSPWRLLLSYSQSLHALFLLWVQTGPSIAYPCDRRRQPWPVPEPEPEPELVPEPEPGHSHQKSPKVLGHKVHLTGRQESRSWDGKHTRENLKQLPHARRGSQPSCTATATATAPAPATATHCSEAVLHLSNFSLALLSPSPSNPTPSILPPALTHNSSRKSNPAPSAASSSSSSSSSSLNQGQTVLPPTYRRLITDPARTLWVLSCPVLCCAVLPVLAHPPLLLPRSPHPILLPVSGRWAAESCHPWVSSLLRFNTAPPAAL